MMSLSHQKVFHTLKTKLFRFNIGLQLRQALNLKRVTNMPFDITRDQYVSVLETEVETLRKYYDPQTEGTGHFNTAIGVLQRRIDEIKKGNQNAI
jgi:hypothetical protein